MRYEDLYEHPEDFFGKMSGFLGLNPDEARLARAVKNASFEVLSAQEKERGFKEKPEHARAFFRGGRPGQWREELSEDQVRQIVSDHRTQMERFGYVPEGF